MSAFEKLPREIRDLIYEYCLLYEGEIVPFPRDYERVGYDRYPLLLDTAMFPESRGLYLSGVDPRGPFLGYPRVERESWQTELKPCVALLGVNSTIREEAAIVLFGKNVWRLSPMSYVQDDRYLLWKTFASYFQHIVLRFDNRDMDDTKYLDIKMRETARQVERSEDAEDSDGFDLTGSVKIHEEELELLKDSLTARWHIVQQMKLKSLSLDFSRLYCSSHCCGHDNLQSCLAWIASFGPRFGLPQVDEIKVVGLKDKKENKLFWEALGAKLD